MKLSVIIPVYNEEKTIRRVANLVKKSKIEKEVVIIDDGSTDGTKMVLNEIKGWQDNGIKIIHQKKNCGKGLAIRAALGHLTGEIVIIQDADLEYDPSDYQKLVDPIKKRKADVVYGSRFVENTNYTLSHHYLLNRFLTSLTNLLYGSNLTDMETCYKLMKRDIFEGLNLRSKRFEVEAEITAKILKKGLKIFEVPITYRGRDYHQGKKITWRDGIATILTLFKYKLLD